MFCLCRTDPDAPKHRGISYVLVPMKRRRRRVERLRAATDPADHRHERLHRDVHHRGAGAAVQRDRRAAQRVAGHDDDARQRARRQRHDPARAVREAVLARRRGGAPARASSDDPLVRQKLAWAYTHAEIMRFAGLRTLSEVVARKEPGPGASINKMFWSEYARDLGEWMMNLRGAESMMPARPATATTRSTAGSPTSSRAGRARSGAAPRRCSATSSASACSGSAEGAGGG